MTTTPAARITASHVRERLDHLRALRQGILARRDEILPILVNAGLTHASASFDLSLFSYIIDSATAERRRLEGRMARPGRAAVLVPFDVPNFLAAFYGLHPYLAGLPVHLHFAGAVRRLAAIWEGTIRDLAIPDLTVDCSMSGREFATHAMADPETRHLILAGGRPIVDQYGSPTILGNSLDTVMVFGPTRPMALFLDDYVGRFECDTIAQTAMFSSGQVCGLTKEIIATPGAYDVLRQGLIDSVSHVSFGTPHDPVGPIRDSGTLASLIEVLAHCQDDPKYRILCGGDIHCTSRETVVEPTLIEVEGEIDSWVTLFGPVLFLSRASNAADLVRRALANPYGYLASVYTLDINRAFEIYGSLVAQHPLSRINCDIMSLPIGQPYGGTGPCFSVITREDRAPGAQKRQGALFFADVFTCS